MGPSKQFQKGGPTLLVLLGNPKQGSKKSIQNLGGLHRATCCSFFETVKGSKPLLVQLGKTPFEDLTN